MDDSGSAGCPVTFTQEGTRTIFILFAVFWWVGFPLSFVLVGLPFVIAAVVLGSIIMYRHWLLLQGHGARTTPGKAVGFGFIPLFNFYWWFVEYAGLATDNNEYMWEHRLAGPYLSRDLAIAICVIGIVGVPIALVRYLGPAVAIVHAVLYFIFVQRQKACIVSIIKYRESLAQSADAAE